MAYTITFYTNGGTEIAPIEVETGSTYETVFRQVSTTREGYEFAGWYGAADCVFAFNPTAKIERNQWFYARWSEVVNREHWYMNTLGRSDESPNPVYSNTNINWHVPLSSALHYILWNRTINAVRFQFAKAGTFYVEVYPDGADEPNTGTYQPLVRREIVVDADHQENEHVVCNFDPIYVQNGQIVALSVPTGVTTAPFKIVTSGTAVSDGNILRYIGNKNQQSNYTGGNPNIDIGFIDNSNVKVEYVSTPGQLNVALNESVTITAVVSPEDAFDKSVSWSIVSGSSNISITPSDDGTCSVTGLREGTAVVRVTTNDGAKTSDTTINVSRYHTYTATFNSNGGSYVADIQYTPDGSVSSLPRPTKAHFHFVGWFESETLTGDIRSSIPSGTSRNLTLYAKWIPDNVYTHFSGRSCVFVGDSVSTYWEDYLDYEFYNCHYTQSVCQQYGITRNTTLYGQLIQELGMNLKVLNASNYAGVCYASRSQLMGANYQHIINNIGYNGIPDVIFVFLGVNDLYGIGESAIREFDPEADYVVGELDRTTVFHDSSDYTKGYVTMIRRIMDMYPTSEIVCMTTYCGTSESANASVRKAANQVHAICEHYGLIHIDFARSDMHIGTYNGELYTIDGIVHPANKGFQVLAEYAIESLSEQLQSTSRYCHLKSSDGVKLRVDSAIRDGAGRRIDTKYVRSVNGNIVPENGNINGVSMDGHTHKVADITDINTLSSTIGSALNAETKNNKVTSVTQTSTDTQYPSARAVYSVVANEIARHAANAAIGNLTVSGTTTLNGDLNLNGSINGISEIVCDSMDVNELRISGKTIYQLIVEILNERLGSGY